ncbi:MAG: N-acyl homoserine lactonase family protein [Pseudomonadota bacterium]
MDDLWEVYAIKYAERNSRTRHQSFVLDDDHATPHDMDYFLWVLRSGSRTIVVDTGYDEAEGKRRGRPILRDPVPALKSVDVAADSVDTLILTHLHYDHAGGIDLFPRAQIHLQEAELSFVTGPCMCHGHLRKPFSADHVCSVIQRLYSGRITIHNGDGLIAPGVTVHHIGGHTAGLQAVRVKTKSGWFCLASDASHYYENFLTGTPFPIVVDVAAMLDGFQTIQGLASKPSLVVPGHDPLVFDYFEPMDGLAPYVRRLDLGPRSDFC